MRNFLAHLLIYMKSLPGDAHPHKRPRESLKLEFRYSVPREWVRLWYHWEWFLNPIWAIRIKVSFPGVEISKNPGIQPNHEFYGQSAIKLQAAIWKSEILPAKIEAFENWTQLTHWKLHWWPGIWRGCSVYLGCDPLGELVFGILS